MTEAKKIIIYLILITILIGCQEVYYPRDIDASLEIPAIEGYIDDTPRPYKVELFWATAFDEKSNNPIRNARVTISDNLGNRATLTETHPGVYLTNKEDIIGTPGRSYTLHVEMEDGSIFESTPALMQHPEEIDTIYAEIGVKEYISKNSFGELIITRRGGLYVYTDINADPASKRFFRFDNRLVSQTHYYVHLYPPPDTLNPNQEMLREPVDVFCWTISGLNDMINIKSTFNSTTEQVIKRHNLGFLPYYFDPRWQDDTTGPLTPRGWIVTTTAYSLTENAYEYYNSVIRQLSAEERIFDPVPSQIKGNIYCLTDTTRIVLGLFEVASRTVRHTAFNWYTARDSYDILDLPDYSSPSNNGCQDTIMPDFWITFY